MGLQLYSAAAVQYCSVATLQYCSTTALQYFSIATLRLYRTSALQCYGITVPQHYRSWVKNVTIQRPESVTPLRFNMKSLKYITAAALLCSTTACARLTLTEHLNSEPLLSATELLSQVLDKPSLRRCSLSILTADNTTWSTDLTVSLVERYADSDRLLQVFTLRPGELPAAPHVWSDASCSVYLFIAKNPASLLPAFSADDKHWNFGGSCVTVSCLADASPTIQLQHLAASYKLQKTVSVLLIALVRRRGRSGRPEGSWEALLYTHKLYSCSSCSKLQLLSSWHSGLPLPSPLFRDKTRDLRGARVRVYTFRYEPAVLATEHPNGTLTDVAGVDGRMVHSLAKALNFTPEFRHPGPLLWGDVNDNGSTYGMTKLMKDDMGEIGVANYFIRLARYRVASFSSAYDFDTNCFLTAVPHQKPRYLAILLPFTYAVWLLLAGTMVFFSMIIPLLSYGISRQSDQLLTMRTWLGPEPSLYRTTRGTIILIIAVLTKQSFVQPKRWGMKMVVMVLLMASLFITLYYSTALTATLTVPTYEQPIRSIRQLLQTDMRVGSIADNWRQQFLLSDNPDIRQLALRYDNLDDYPSHISDVIEGKLAIFSVLKVLRLLTNTLPQQSQVRTMEECPYTYNVGALLKRNSPLKINIDKAILHMSAGGLLSRYLEETLRDLRRRDRPERPAKHAEQQDKQVMTLEHLQVGKFNNFEIDKYSMIKLIICGNRCLF
ncbi:Ionotropic glutamate receptor [Trinorchestia longiramus]|nr:Ionotropic glutamate receptor [Trinorchestia longiramus]